MALIKQTDEYRFDTEEEVKSAIDTFKKQAYENGYLIKSCGYTYKEKKQKGEVIDSGFLLKIVKEFSTFWE